VPDTEQPALDVPFEVCLDAALNIDRRLALYSAAMLNAGVNSGPLGFCWYSQSLPYLTLRMQDSSQRETTTEYFVLCGLTPGCQYPWATLLQRLVWQDDTEENLLAAFEDWHALRP
jgi:hypothetical protein